MDLVISPFERPAGRLVYDAQGMREVDAYAIDACGVPGAALMETAGRHVALAATRYCAEGGHILIVAGGGNNGGDGFVAARHLKAWGFRVSVVLVAAVEKLSGEARVFFQALEHLDVSLEGPAALGDLMAAGVEVVVDAMLGTGLHGPVRPEVAHVIGILNGAQVARVAVDMPTGICSDTGSVMGMALNATATVTFGSTKVGHWMYPGSGHCGRLEVVDIGLPHPTPVEPRARVMAESDLEVAFEPRPRNAHKGDMGRVLALGGGPGRTGAIKMASDAAMTAGAGLVTIGTSAHALGAFLPELYEVMAAPLLDDAVALVAAAQAADSLIVGPGFPEGDQSKQTLLELFTQVDTPMVVDADGLNHLAALGKPWRHWTGGNRILTPHPGEAARLLRCSTREVQADRLGSLRRLVHASRSVCVLKGAHSLVGSPDGRVWICPEGNPGMATAGSGDVLAGVIGALLARSVSVVGAAVAGVYWHARAGDVGAMLVGEHCLRARDIVEALPEVERLVC